MNMIEFRRLMRRIACGEFDCLAQCCAEGKLIELVRTFGPLSDDELSIVQDELCNLCPVPGEDGSPLPPSQPGGPSGPPGSDYLTPQMQECVKKLLALACTDKVKSNMNIVIANLEIFEPVFPEQQAIAKGALSFLKAIQAFCNEPKGSGTEKLIFAICTGYPYLKALLDWLAGEGPESWSIEQALKELVLGELGKVLDACCKAQDITPDPAGPIPQLPPGPIAAGPSPSTSTSSSSGKPPIKVAARRSAPHPTTLKFRGAVITYRR